MLSDVDVGNIDMGVINRIVKKPENFLITVRDALNALPDDYSSDDITNLAEKLYNEHIKPDSNILDNISDKQKDSASYRALNIGSDDPSPDVFSFWNHLDATAEKYKQYKAVTSEIQPTDTVAVTGNTMKWKDDIKKYADRYGVAVKGKRKYLWDSRNTRWLLSYQAFTKLKQDYPNADIQCEKVN